MIQNPGTGTARRARELDWLLDDLVGRVHEVRHAVVLSNDGLAVGASHGLAREDGEHLAAVASGFHSLAKGRAGTSAPGECTGRWSRWTTATCSWPRPVTVPASPSSPP